MHVVESESEWRSVRKSEGESKPDANSAPSPNALPDTKLIHTAHIPFNYIFDILTDIPPAPIPHPPSIEFHTAIDICFEICLQIIYITHDVVITPSCFTTCASTSNQEVVKKWSRSELSVKYGVSW